jgi:DNA-binding transcriptional regulator YiaG
MQPPELKRIRRRLGVTQAALAAQVGVTGNTIARWERGEVPIGAVAARLLRTLTATPATGRVKAKANPERKRPARRSRS